MEIEFDKAALETINFQSNSKLGARINNLFREIMLYRDEVEKKFDLNDYGERLKFFDILESFVDKRISDNLQKIILEESGVNIKSIQFIPIKQSCGIIGISLRMNNTDMIHIIGEMINGYNIKNKGHNKRSMEFVEELVEYSKHLDLKKSYFDFNKTNKKLNCQLYLDIGVAFVFDMVSTVTDKDDRLTSEELTSIILHEIGHIITSLEYVAYRQYLGVYGTQALVKERKKVNTPAEYIKEIDAIKMIDKIKELDVDVQESDLTIFQKILNKLGSTTIAKTIAAALIILIEFKMAISLLMQSFVVRIATRILYISNLFNKTSNTSEYQTKRNKFVTERLADEFVSRHGYGGYLSNGLRKIFKMQQNTILINPYIVMVMKSLPIVKYSSLLTSVMKSFFSKSISSYIPYPYEEDYDRLIRLFQNNMAIFKNPDLPAAIRDNYIRDTEMIIKSIKDYKKSSSNIIGIFNSIRVFLSSIDIKVIDRIINGDISEKQLKDLEALDNLMNNELYFIASKFKQKLG